MNAGASRTDRIPSSLTTYWRFLLPSMLLLIAVPAVLMQQQIARQLEDIHHGASAQAREIAQLLEVSETLLGQQAERALFGLQQQPATQAIAAELGGGDPAAAAGRAAPLVAHLAAQWGGSVTLYRHAAGGWQPLASSAPGHPAPLPPAAAAALAAGQPFLARGSMQAQLVLSRYAPARDAGGRVTGAWRLDYPLDSRHLLQALGKFSHSDSGFAAIVDAGGTPLLLSAQMARAAAEQRLRRTPPGWQVIRENLPGWNLQVVVAYPATEARAAVLASSLPVMLAGGFLGLAIISIMLSQLRRLILDPVGGDPAAVIRLVQQMAAGDLEQGELHARPGTLLDNVLLMRDRLRELVGRLHQNAERMGLSARVFELAHDAIFIADRSAHIVEVNPAFTKITGYAREEALGRTPWQLGLAWQDEKFFNRIWQQPQANGEHHSETYNRHKNGERYIAWLDLFVVRDAAQQITHYVGLFSDITLFKKQQQNLEHLAYHDPLTQLPNRTLLADRLHQALARASRSGHQLAVCYFDLDGFKPINDRLGHEAGDRLLIELARRVRAALRESDTIARLGGDEFAVLLSDLNSVEECQHTLNRLLAVIKAPFVLGDHLAHISASIGFTIFPSDNSEPDTLLRHADHAMYQAKISGGNRHHLFDAEHDRQERDRRQERERIEAALHQGEFTLHYQPRIDMRHRAVVAAEALIRWQHPEHGLRLPGEFLPAIEHTDFIIELGEWALQQALRQADQWRQQGLELVVSINIAARHLMQPDFAARLAAILRQHPQVSPRQLELEITETAAIEDIAGVAHTIQQCKQLGVTFALDDFGIGYSSLTYLRRLPVETIKIDQSFVRDMLEDGDDLAVVAGVIGLSREFGRQVVAEGVESARHGAQLLQMGCSMVQGYGIARPMPAEQMPAWIRQFQPDASWAAMPGRDLNLAV